MASKTDEYRETMAAIFGPEWDSAPEPERLRGVRVRAMSSGHMTLAHPGYLGPEVIAIQQVPGSVSDAEIVRRMNFVTVLRRGTHMDGYRGARVIHYGEIKTGAIIR